MGAYENPAMIVDKSGEILAAGILQGVQSLAQGVDKYSQTVKLIVRTLQQKLLHKRNR